MLGEFKVVRSGDVRLCAQSFGDMQDSAVVLVMGATASMMWWPDRLCHALAQAGRFVVRFDHRDTGASSTGATLTAPYDVLDMADDLVAVLDGYGIVRAHLVGMSLGGMISQLVALLAPARVATLTLISAEPLGGEPLPPLEMSEPFLAHFAGLEALDWNDADAVRAFLDGIARLSSSPRRGYDRVGTAERIARELSRTSDIRAAFRHATLRGELGGWDLRSIRAPTLVIHGREDPIVPLAHGEAIARQVDGAALQVLPDAGHELHNDDLGMIADWIIGHTSQPLAVVSARAR